MGVLVMVMMRQDYPFLVSTFPLSRSGSGTLSCYSTPIELKRVVVGAEHRGVVIVAGDVNAHLDPSSGPRAYDNLNV